MRSSWAPVLVVITLAVSTAGCLTEERYITPDEGGPWVIPIDETTPPYFAADEITLYLLEQRVEIPFREPTEDELAELGDVGDAQIPYPQLPYLRRGDIEIEIDWTLSNLSDEEATAAVQVNGFNEFHEYNPGVSILDDEVLIDFSGWERLYVLDPGERRRGTVREAELDEVAVDLATVVNGAPNANQIVYFGNQSAHDERSQPYIPDVIPALTGARVGLRAQTGEGEAAPALLLEFTVRVRDPRRVLVQGDDEPWAAPAPALFGPADAAAAASP